MNRFNLLILTAFISASFYFSSAASACSLVNLSQEDLKARMIPQIAKTSNVDASKIDPSNLSDVKLEFLVPLGGDCSGLYGAYHASAFNFTLNLYPTVQCTYTGLAIIMGYGLDKPVSVQAFRQCKIS